jgi:soluble lytic murein transglycosylase-like protein
LIRKLLTLTLLLISCLLANPNQSQAATSKATVKDYIVKHSMELGVDPALGLSIAKMESGFVHEKKSSYGAVGVFQLMPSTAKRLGYNPYLLSDNIRGGLMYYKMMYQKFGSVELALAAYNAGPGNVSKYKGVPPFAETKRFVREIMSEYNSQKASPDPAIVKYKTQKSDATQNSSKIDKENNVVTKTENTTESLPFVSLSGTI